MTMRLDEVRREISQVRNRIRCVITDQESSKEQRRYWFRSHYESFSPLAEKLARLRDKYYRADELIAEHEARIDELCDELLHFLNKDRIVKMLRLIKQVNSANKNPTDIRIAHEEMLLTKERATDLRYMIKAYQNEIAEINRLRVDSGKKFFAQEASLVRAVVAQTRALRQRLANIVEGDSVLETSYSRLDELLALEKNMTGDRKVQKMSQKANELVELMRGMPRDIVEMLLGETGVDP